MSLGQEKLKGLDIESCPFLTEVHIYYVPLPLWGLCGHKGIVEVISLPGAPRNE